MTLKQAKAGLDLAKMEYAANKTEQNQKILEAAQAAYDELATPAEVAGGAAEDIIPPKELVGDQATSPEGTAENSGESRDEGPQPGSTAEKAGESGKEKVETDPSKTPGTDSAAGSDPEKKSND